MAEESVDQWGGVVLVVSSRFNSHGKVIPNTLEVVFIDLLLGVLQCRSNEENGIQNRIYTAMIKTCAGDKNR